MLARLRPIIKPLPTSPGEKKRVERRIERYTHTRTNTNTHANVHVALYGCPCGWSLLVAGGIDVLISTRERRIGWNDTTQGERDCPDAGERDCHTEESERERERERDAERERVRGRERERETQRVCE